MAKRYSTPEGTGHAGLQARILQRDAGATGGQLERLNSLGEQNEATPRSITNLEQTKIMARADQRSARLAATAHSLKRAMSAETGQRQEPRCPTWKPARTVAPLLRYPADQVQPTSRCGARKQLIERSGRVGTRPESAGSRPGRAAPVRRKLADNMEMGRLQIQIGKNTAPRCRRRCAPAPALLPRRGDRQVPGMDRGHPSAQGRNGALTGMPGENCGVITTNS